MWGASPTKTIPFILGERKNVFLEVALPDGQDFAVTDATYVLRSAQEVEDQGPCDVIRRDVGDYVLSALLEPKRPTNYVLTYTYRIGEEIRKAHVYVPVCGKGADTQ